MDLKNVKVGDELYYKSTEFSRFDGCAKVKKIGRMYIYAQIDRDFGGTRKFHIHNGREVDSGYYGRLYKSKETYDDRKKAEKLFYKITRNPLGDSVTRADVEKAMNLLGIE